MIWRVILLWLLGANLVWADLPRSSFVPSVAFCKNPEREYDAYDRLTGFTNGNGYVIHYGYDANGNLATLTYPGNLTVNYYYDPLNRMTNVTDWAGRATTNLYDLAGELTNTARPNGTVRTNGYDAAGQTTNIVECYATGVMAIEYIALSWNNAARMQWEFVAPLPHPYTPPTRTMTFDADNRLATFNLTSVTRDNDGNMTYGPGTNNSFGTYTYDARNRLTSAGGFNYGYDSCGTRILMTNGSVITTNVIDPESSQLLMRIRAGITNYYVYGVGLLYEIDTTATTTNTLYYHYDSRGSTVALTDANGNITDRMEYSAYAMPTYRLGTNDTPFLYNGRYGVQTDPNGLLFMRARYYNPYICRFINADPSGFGGGLNMHAFADGNPVSEMDPFGLGAAGTSSGFSWIGHVDASAAGPSSILPGPYAYFGGTGAASGMAAGALNIGSAVGNGLYQAVQGFLSVAGAVGQAQNAALSAVGIDPLAAAALLPETGIVGDLGAAAEGIATPYGTAVQGTTTEAQAALTEVKNGATVFRQGQFGVQNTGNAQFWSIENPASTPNFTGQLGMPGGASQTVDWMMGGQVPSGASVITRAAPGIGANAGGALEAVTPPGGIQINWFHMP